MSLIEFIFGESKYKIARREAKEFFLANKITKKEYLELLKEIDDEEEFNSI